MEKYLLLLFLVHPSFTQDNTPIINTSFGRIKGISEIYGSEVTYQFRNIPYAKPPVGELRFQKPQRSVPWQGIRDGTQFGASCMQDTTFLEQLGGASSGNVNISEDCLSLNVYIPRQLPQPKDKKKSVMIWVHGGAFILGQGDTYDGSALALRGDVIVVTINYRLGIFGFLSTEDSAAPGNYGLWDQQLAFKWVKDNIASFGGNPDSITIFGESAGGFSVSYHSLSPLNKGLFSRVISQSGVSNSYLAKGPESLYYAKQYGQIVGCANLSESVDTSRLVSCMRTKSSDELLSAQKTRSLSRTDRYRLYLTVGPVVDGELILESPTESLKNASSESNKMFRSLDFLAGNCNSEGSLGFYNLYRWSSIRHFNFLSGLPTNVFCDTVVPGLVQELYQKSAYQSFVVNAICNKYKTSTSPAQQAREFTDMYGDAFFVSPAVEMLEAHSSTNTLTKSYQYMFNRPSLIPVGLINPSWFTGSGHASEINFLFGFENLLNFNISTTASDSTLSETMLSYWTNFAKTGDPNGAGLPSWPTYDPVNSTYINLDYSITTRDHVYQDRTQFWTRTVPGILQGSS